jgi:hypothetical protein
MLFFFLDYTITEAMSHHDSQQRLSFNPRPGRFLFRYFGLPVITLPVLLSDTEFMYHQRYMISALDSIIKLFFTSSSSSSSLLINHINDCTFQKIVLPGVFFFILHFMMIHTLLATFFTPSIYMVLLCCLYVMISSPVL